MVPQRDDAPPHPQPLSPEYGGEGRNCSGNRMGLRWPCRRRRKRPADADARDGDRYSPANAKPLAVTPTRRVPRSSSPTRPTANACCKSSPTSIAGPAADFRERGLHILHLACGVLEWRDPDDEPLRSPLLLVPVALQRKSLREPVRPEAHGRRSLAQSRPGRPPQARLRIPPARAARGLGGRMLHGLPAGRRRRHRGAARLEGESGGGAGAVLVLQGRHLSGPGRQRRARPAASADRKRWRACPTAYRTPHVPGRARASTNRTRPPCTSSTPTPASGLPWKRRRAATASS